jgi:von Willebrand factor type A domain
VVAGITFLTPAGAAIGGAALLPVLAVLAAGARVGRVRRALSLPPPRAGFDVVAVTALAATVGVLAVAAAQPALAHDVTRSVRTDVQVQFVVDVSGSMAASSSPTAPTRLDRAIAGAQHARAAIPNVEAGVATLTDRVLPDLLPVADQAAFDATLTRAVGIEQPPPDVTAVNATSFDALSDVVTGNYFVPTARKRIVVLLTDGESRAFDAASVARVYSSRPGVELVALRFWGAHDAIYLHSGRIDPGYRPDPAGGLALHQLAVATGGRTFDGSQLSAAEATLQKLVGNGPRRPTTAATRGFTPLAPYVALLALVPLAVASRRRFHRFRSGRTVAPDVATSASPPARHVARGDRGSRGAHRARSRRTLRRTGA